jgi:hypothetical protein
MAVVRREGGVTTADAATSSKLQASPHRGKDAGGSEKEAEGKVRDFTVLRVSNRRSIKSSRLNNSGAENSASK